MAAANGSTSFPVDASANELFSMSIPADASANELFSTSFPTDASANELFSTSFPVDASANELWNSMQRSLHYPAPCLANKTPDLFWDANVNGSAHTIQFLTGLVQIDGQNKLIYDHGGPLFHALKMHAPHWYEIAADAFIATYAWHGTTDPRPLLQALVITLINQAHEKFVSFNPGWNVEHVIIPFDNTFYLTSFDNPQFMTILKKAVAAAQAAFYARTLDVVRYLLLPSHSEPIHPGVIDSDTILTPHQFVYINNLVTWDTSTGFNLWHDFCPDNTGVMTTYLFQCHSLVFLIQRAHFEVWSPGYMYIQQLYKNPETGCEEWGSVTTAKLHSTTWLLTTANSEEDGAWVNSGTE
ncbi:hypothetical protein BU15DRAFT_69552 [Melanogaster broomeanus]|nr:hypothetical protein BU15DRAFT_69577 [Melanogaster broomeanus]KAF9230022.1 hypothetical protein BU15DRAFT_69552 [Melanogaster broomeanus]